MNTICTIADLTADNLTVQPDFHEKYPAIGTSIVVSGGSYRLELSPEVAEKLSYLLATAIDAIHREKERIA